MDDDDYKLWIAIYLVVVITAGGAFLAWLGWK